MPLLFRTLVIVFFLFFIFLNLSAQNSLTGNVIDRQSGQTLEFVQVALMHARDSSLISGTLGDINGRFSLQTNVNGQYLVMFSFIGYETKWKPVEIQRGANKLGVVKLNQSLTQLDEVQITAAASLFRSEADRRVFNVENMTVAEGGTAIQLLETLPSVQVDDEGKVNLRGSGNILIYINGRPTNLSADDNESILQQYPANIIKEVELITNPSARFDAEGVGGIINLVLKEGSRQGFNAQLNLSAGTGNKYTGGLNLNLRHNRWNIFANYSYQYREFWEDNESFRENFTGNISPIIDLDFYTQNFNRSHILRTGAQYDLGENSSISIYSSINGRARDRGRTYYIRNLSSPSVLDSMYIRQLDEDQSSLHYEFGAGYIWENDNGQKLSAHVTHSQDSQDRIEFFNQAFFDVDMMEIEEKLHDQIYKRPYNNKMTVIELDYTQDLGSKMKLESGLKSTIRRDNLSQEFGQLNLLTDQYEEVVLSGIPINNQYVLNEDIHAAYIIVRNTNGKFSYLAGLRAEMTDWESWQESGLRSDFLNVENFSPAIDTSTYNRYFNLFPSLFLSYKIGKNQDIQTSYSRRIRRPGSGQLMPFINAQDFFNLRLGNPYLEPSFSNNYEINYIRAWENYMFTAGVFHRHTVNAHSRYFVPFEQSSMVTWTNSGSTNASGMELINYYTLNSNYNATLTANIFHTRVNGELNGERYNNQRYSWTLSFLGNMIIPNLFSAQLSANYWGPQIIPQGYIKQVFSMNLGLRRNVFSNQGTVSLNISDVLNTRDFWLETTGAVFYQQRHFYSESRVVTLSFTWRFRNYLERNDQPRERGIEGEINGLF